MEEVLGHSEVHCASHPQYPRESKLYKFDKFTLFCFENLTIAKAGLHPEFWIRGGELGNLKM